MNYFTKKWSIKMYDTNPHLSNKELVENLRGGAHQGAGLDVSSTKSTNAKRVPNAIGLITVSLLALHASAYHSDVTQVGFVLISLVSAMLTLHAGLSTYKEQADQTTATTDGWLSTGFLLANACLLLLLGVRSLIALVY
jgi:hypothetical protein